MEVVDADGINKEHLYTFNNEENNPYNAVFCEGNVYISTLFFTSWKIKPFFNPVMKRKKNVKEAFMVAWHEEVWI